MPDPHPFIGSIEKETDEVLATLRQMVELESPSDDKQACDRMAAWLQERLEAAGFKTERLANPGCGDHLKGILRWGPGDAQPGIMLLGHFDTVWPVGEITKRPWREADGRVYGPGIYDMKGGIALMLQALSHMRRHNLRPRLPVTVLLNSDEELGSATSRAAIEAMAAQSRYVLVFEPGDMPQGQVNTFRKGVIHFELHVTGRAAHAGADHRTGRNAVAELARHITRLEDLTDYAKGTTVNVGRVSGGRAANVMAPHAVAHVDVRVSTAAEADRMERLIDRLEPSRPGFGVAVKHKLSRPPLERHRKVADLYQQARRMAAALGLSLPERPSGGASDGNFTAALGVATLCGIGIVGDGAHAIDEHIVTEWIPRRLALIVRLLERLE